MSWIKLREDLHDDPAVLTISARCKVSVWHTVGVVARVWAWAGRLTVDGRVPHASAEMIDAIAQTPGLAVAMQSVGWLVLGDSFVEFPKWDRHNGEAAKARAVDAERKRASRNKDAESGNERNGIRALQDERPSGVQEKPDTRPDSSGRDSDQRRGEKRREESTPLASLEGAREGKPDGKARKEPTGPQADAIRAWESTWLELRGEVYAWTPKEAASVARGLALAKGDLGAFSARVRRLLADPPDAWYAQNACPSLLADRWNQLAVRVLEGGTSPTRDRAAAGLKRMEAEL